jgi:hypothetical protein
MKKAVYYLGSKALKGIVIEEGKNADGPTVTLAKKEGGKPFICGAPVSKTPQPGHAVLGDSADAVDADDEADDQSGDEHEKLDP